MSLSGTYQRQLKTPIGYYGGKQNLLKEIIPLIPEHHTYVEPFFGGGAVYFGKHPSPMEIINDLNDNVINFYWVLKNQYKGLIKEVKGTLHSRSTQKLANSILYYPKYKNKIKRAWAFWVMCTQSYSNDPRKNAGFAYDTLGSTTKKVVNAKENLISNFGERLSKTQVECTNAIKVIKSRDSKDTFFYIDPPYVSSNCGSYSGYSLEDFKLLLDTLSSIKGKFLLSSYPEEVLLEYRKKKKWFSKDLVKRLSVYGKRKTAKHKKECLTANYNFMDSSFQSFKPTPTDKPKNMTISLNGISSKSIDNLEIRFINRFCNLHGRMKTRRQIKLFVNALQKAISSKEINRSSTYSSEIMEIQDDLIKLYRSFSSNPVIKVQIGKKKLLRYQKIVAEHMGSSSLNGPTSPYRNKIMNSTEIIKLDFEKLGFKNKWLKLVGDPSKGFTAMVYGKPKMGKSYLCVDFAGYLARNHGQVLYVAREEGIDDTLQKKLKDKKVAHPNLYVSDYLPSSLSDFDFVFLDSVNKLGLSPHQLEQIKNRNPNTSFIYIFQTTKQGNFRGGNEFQHDVDIVIEVPEKGKAVQYGRFNQGGEINIF